MIVVLIKEMLLYIVRTLVILVLTLFFAVTCLGRSKPPVYPDRPFIQENRQDENVRNSVRGISGDDKTHPKQP